MVTAEESGQGIWANAPSHPRTLPPISRWPRPSRASAAPYQLPRKRAPTGSLRSAGAESARKEGPRAPGGPRPPALRRLHLLDI